MVKPVDLQRPGKPPSCKWTTRIRAVRRISEHLQLQVLFEWVYILIIVQKWKPGLALPPNRRVFGSKFESDVDVSSCPADLVSCVNAEFPKGQPRRRELHDALTPLGIRTKLGMSQEEADPGRAFSRWSREDNDAVVLVAQVATKEPNISCEKRYPATS